MSDPLVTYLEDHKAGAGLAIGLLQAMEARHDDESLSQAISKSLLMKRIEIRSALLARELVKRYGSTRCDFAPSRSVLRVRGILTT